MLAVYPLAHQTMTNLVSISEEVIELIPIDLVDGGLTDQYIHPLKDVIDMIEKFDIFFTGVSQQVDVSIINKFTSSYTKKRLLL